MGRSWQMWTFDCGEAKYFKVSIWKSHPKLSTAISYYHICWPPILHNLARSARNHILDAMFYVPMFVGVVGQYHLFLEWCICMYMNIYIYICVHFIHFIFLTQWFRGKTSKSFIWFHIPFDFSNLETPPFVDDDPTSIELVDLSIKLRRKFQACTGPGTCALEGQIRQASYPRHLGVFFGDWFMCFL